MQTFLVSPNFAESASVLDNKRLGKQRVECLQILQTLAFGPYQLWDHTIKKWIPAIEKEYNARKFTHARKTPWYNHPAVRMWRGHTNALAHYGQVICEEWCKRGFKDACTDKIAAFFTANEAGNDPVFIGNPDFHASHRSNLLRKDPDHYSQFGWTEPNNLPYIWPV
jgi:hypothetical protein